MSTSLMAILMLAIIITLILTKKIPMSFVLAFVPIIFALLMGIPIPKLSETIIKQINTIMRSSGYMLLFALMYFTMLSETGMFEILIDKIMKFFKVKTNIWIVMIFTSLIAGIGALTSSVVTSYLITFPIMLPLYKSLDFDKKNAMIIAQTSIAAMGFVPWGIAMTMTSAFANLAPMELVNYVAPICLCFIPVIILQWIYFGLKHKKQMHIKGNPSTQPITSIENETQKKANPNARPEKFWINFLIFLCSVVALAYFKIPGYLVFIFSSLLTLLINYTEPKQYQPIWSKSSVAFYNVILMMIGIGVFLVVFKETGMMKSVAGLLVAIFPGFLTRYMHIILLALCVIITRFIPFEIFSSLYPVLIGIGATFGLSPAFIIAPFVGNLALGTGSSPLNSTTYVGTSLLGIDMGEYAKRAMPIQTVTNIIVIIIGLIFGVIK